MTNPPDDPKSGNSSEADRVNEDRASDSKSPTPEPETPDAVTIPPSDPDSQATLPPRASTLGAEDATLAPSSDFETGRPAGTNPSGPQLPGFGDYELLGEIARGGMGVVYKARQISLNRIVALKMILAGQLAGEQEVQRFHMEAESAANLDHPGIVPIYEVGEIGGQHYFSMGFVEGDSLSGKVSDGPLPCREATEITKKVAEAIAYAHDKGVIHRDLKPANILMEKDGQPKVTDFGLAKRVEVDSGLTATGQVLGTPSFMPPEQAAGEIEQSGPLMDVYSLGAILYNLLTGRPPFQASSVMDTLMQVLEREPVPPRQLNSDVDRDLETICLKCLEKDPHRRYTSAAQLVKDLSRYLRDEPIEARPSSSAYKLWRKAKRNRVTSMAIAAAVVAVVGGGGLFWQFRQKASEADVASQTAKGALQALQRMQQETGIQQLAVISFRNLSGNPQDDWLGNGFASELQTKLSSIETLKVVGKGQMVDALAELSLPTDATLDSTGAERLGQHLVVNHVIMGEFQRLAEQIQVSARIVNIETGAIDRGGMHVRGNLSDVFDLQNDLANQCLAQLGVATGETNGDETPDSETVASTVETEAQDEAPAASVEAWMLLAQGQYALGNRDSEEAIRLLTLATQEDPKLAKAYRALGQAYQTAERNEDAVAAFKKAVELEPNDLVSLTYFHLLSGRIAEGFAAMSKASEAGVADLDMLKMSVPLRLQDRGDAGKELSEEVIKDLKRALEKHAKDDELWILLAAAYGSAEKEELSIEAVQKAVEAKPNSYKTHLFLSLAYEDKGRKEDAERELGEAERLRPEGGRGFRAFGSVYLHTGNIERAVEQFKRALELEPDHGGTHVLLGGTYAAKLDFGNALVHFEKALVDQPNSPLVLGGLCRITNLIQDNARLEKYATQWAEADADSYEAHQYLRIAYMKTGRKAEAAAEAKVLADLTPTHSSFFFMTGNALLQASPGNAALLDEAVSVLGMGHKEFPADKAIAAMLHLAQGMKFVSTAQWNQAIEVLKKSQEEIAHLPALANISLDCSLYLTISYEKTDRFAEAAEQVRIVAGKYPQLGPKAFEIFKQANRFDYAAELAEKEIKTAPKDFKLHKDLIEYYARSDGWAEAEASVARLPAATQDECFFRIQIGLALADWMEKTRDLGTKLDYIQRLRRETGQQVLSSAATKDDQANALKSWVTSPQNWLIVGPFVSGPDYQGLDAELPPEKELDPERSYEGASALVHWKPVSAFSGNYIDLLKLYPETKQVAVLALSYARSSEEREVSLRVGSDDGVKVWLNDELVLERRVYRQFKEGQDQVNVKLLKGTNKLLVKVDQADGQFGFSLDAVDSAGFPVPLRWSTDQDAELGEVRMLVQDLLDRLLLKEEVLEELQDDSALAPEQRDAALKVAQNAQEDPERLNEASWTVAMVPGKAPEDYLQAIRQAKAACRLDKESWSFRATLGVAQYRADKHDDATEALQQAEMLSRSEIGIPTPRQLAVLAMAHHKLGRAKEAELTFGILRDLMKSEAWASQEIAKDFLNEAKTLLGDALRKESEDAREIEAIKTKLFSAEQAGWLHYDYDSYAKIWTEDVRTTSGRSDQPGPYDVSSAPGQFYAAARLRFQGPPPAGLSSSFETVSAERNGDTAVLQTRTVVRHSGGFETYGGIYRFRMTSDGWKVFEQRGWPINKKSSSQLTKYDRETWKSLDEEVTKRQEKGDLRKLIQTLKDARRNHEVHRATQDLTALPEATASDWRQRGWAALAAGDTDDTIAAFKKALSLDPNLPLPPYDELIVPGPATFRLVGFDLPPDREGAPRSTVSSERATMIFQNQTPYTLEVFWLDYKGKRVGPYWRLPPGSTWKYAGSFNDSWLVCDTRGRALGIYLPNQPLRTIPLREASTDQDQSKAKK